MKTKTEYDGDKIRIVAKQSGYKTRVLADAAALELETMGKFLRGKKNLGQASLKLLLLFLKEDEQLFVRSSAS